MRTWGFGVIGCGSIADFHLKAIREIDAAKLIGVSSRKQDRARETGEGQGCDWTVDYHELLRRSDIDIVCLTTSSGSHAKIGRDVLNAGKHLLVEKPIAMNTADADSLIQLAQEKGLTLAVVSQRRFEEPVQQIKQALLEQRLGKLLYVYVFCPFFRTQEYYDSADWRGTIREDGGALMNQGIHSIDQMLWLVGPVQSVFGKIATKTHQIEAEDLGLALLTFENGAYGTLFSSTCIYPGFQTGLHIFGEKGTIKLEGTEIVHWTVPNFPQPQLKGSSSSGSGASDPLSISTRYHKLQILDFIEALNTNRPPAISGHDGRCAVQLIEAIHESFKQNKEIGMA